ncbi:cilia- and flagella-associated protein 206 isoform X2 [Cephus cinctus]|uniref:Cilia- and flagella-associated protein 206 n=1 Tax=Cephus cinctus TaxID=211228 RepID=A0AAJ7R9F9_CEPCN|nr:cilia- and flagella-associated protein 206 isoform X2 [Cephus cinctus]
MTQFPDSEVPSKLGLTLLNPEYRLLKDEDPDVLEIKKNKIIKFITDKLHDQSRPSLMTIKIQLYFSKHYSHRDDVIKKHRLSLRQKTSPLVTEICEKNHVMNDQDIEKLYQKILVVVTLLSGLGNPTTASVLREVAVALQSVYQPSELRYFVTLSKSEKEEQLMELMCIVAGIRLFNRDCQRGGEGIDDLPSILQRAVTKTQASILDVLEALMKMVYKLTAAVDNALMIRPDDEDDVSSVINKESPGDVTEEDVQFAIEMLAAVRQQEIYVRKLLGDVENCENEIKCLIQRLQGRLFKLHDTVRYRTAIPTAQVYPQFIDLADIWIRLQNEVIVLSQIYGFLWQLENLTDKNTINQEEMKLNKMISGYDILTDAERLEQSMGQTINDCGECLIFYPSVTKDFDKINLEFLGFCAWTFAVGKGALIPGNPNIGVVQWRGKYYAFSSVNAARKFGQDPNRYLNEALDFVRSHPEYIHLLQLYEDVLPTRNRDEILLDGPQPTVQRDQGIQTELHVVPFRVDKDYTFSIWEYRRRAIQLANISQCRTSSTQTYKSHFRSGVYVQAAAPRDKEVQTRKDNCTNTINEETFIFGLRGRRNDTQRVLTLLKNNG